MARFSMIVVAPLFALVCMFGCGSDETLRMDPPKEELEAGDGKIRPDPNGKHVGETAACDALLAAQEAKIKALSCSITTRICPALLRVDFVTPCLEYDEGSVQGCIDFYNMQTTCDGLNAAKNNCLVTSYPGTMEAGCTP